MPTAQLPTTIDRRIGLFMARHFNGTTDFITTSIGALGFAFGPATIVAVFNTKSNVALDRIIFQAGDTNTTPRWLFYYQGATATISFFNGVAPASLHPLTVNEGWVLMACTKATGTVQPRSHKYVYSTNVWLHAASADSVADSGTPLTKTFIGSIQGGNALWDGDVQMIGIWSEVLTDGQIESLALDLSEANWETARGGNVPKALWILNQHVADTVTDLTGGGANQTAITGTTWVDGPEISVVRNPDYSHFPRGSQYG